MKQIRRTRNQKIRIKKIPGTQPFNFHLSEFEVGPFRKIIGRQFEHLTDQLIPYLVILLAVLLLLENPFWTIVSLHQFEPYTTWLDMTIIFFFIVDLTFKWFKIRNLKTFLKLYWLDIIAVFPFYLAFRAYAAVSGLFRVGEEVSAMTQKVAHETVLLREQGLLRETELFKTETRLSELGKETRIFRESGIIREASMLERFTQSIERLLRGLVLRYNLAKAGLLHIHQKLREIREQKKHKKYVFR